MRAMLFASLQRCHPERREGSVPEGADSSACGLRMTALGNKKSRPPKGRDAFPRYHPDSPTSRGARSGYVFIPSPSITGGEPGHAYLAVRRVLSQVSVALDPYPLDV